MAKIIQIIADGKEGYEDGILGLGDDGVVYSANSVSTGWARYIEPLDATNEESPLSVNELWSDEKLPQSS